MPDSMRPEYDLSKLLKGGVKGKYAKLYPRGTNRVIQLPKWEAAGAQD